MRRPSLRLTVVAQLAAVVGAALIPGLARAQPVTCPARGDESASVVISAPEPGNEVSSRVEVRGRVESLVETPSALFQVELFVGDSRKDLVVLDPPVAGADFTLVWDASAARSGASTIHVVACGGRADLGELFRGSASVEVQVPPPSIPPPTRTLVVTRHDEERQRSSVVAGLMIAVPAVVCLGYAMSRRSTRPL